MLPFLIHAIGFLPVEHAFRTHARDDTLDARRLRRALRDLGADVSVPTAARLVDLYGTNASVTLTQTEALVDRAATASPAKLWITLDPRGDLRTRRVPWARFGAAGVRTLPRLAHYAVGAASLAIGAADLAHFALTGASHAVASHAVASHAVASHAVASHAVAHADLHTAAAILSVPRFRYAWSGPWKLWMPTAREANMWPTGIIYAWYSLAMRSDFVRPVDESTFSCADPTFQAFTILTSAILLYGGSRSILEGGELHVSRHVHGAVILSTVTVPLMADTLKCLLVARDPAIHAEYVHLVAQFPEYTSLYTNIMLAGMFAGNLVCALSSARHHGAVTADDTRRVMNALNLLILVLSVVGTLSIGPDALLAKEMVRILLP